jgi:exodeoxyribonuclease-3
VTASPGAGDSRGALRVATHNVNGIRAAVRRGYLRWAEESRPDVICLQEVRALPESIPTEALDGYVWNYTAGDRPGRAGVAVLTRVDPSEVRIGFTLSASAQFDLQGRYLEVDLPGLTVASVYVPKGAGSGVALDAKLRFLQALLTHLRVQLERATTQGREFLIAGDFNIAPTEDDLHWWRRYQRAPGFLPVEREHFAELLDLGLVDVMRTLHPNQKGPYSWWSWISTAWEANAGWRIDLQLTTPGLAGRAVAGWVDRAPTFAQRMSDHAPVVVDYRPECPPPQP